MSAVAGLHLWGRHRGQSNQLLLQQCRPKMTLLLPPPDWAVVPQPCSSQPWMDPAGLLFLVWGTTLILAFLGGAAFYKACCSSRPSQRSPRRGETSPRLTKEMQERWALLEKERDQRELEKQVEREKELREEQERQNRDQMSRLRRHASPRTRSVGAGRSGPSIFGPRILERGPTRKAISPEPGTPERGTNPRSRGNRGGILLQMVESASPMPRGSGLWMRCWWGRETRAGGYEQRKSSWGSSSRHQRGLQRIRKGNDWRKLQRVWELR